MMPSPNVSLSSRARSLSHGVAAIVAGGFGGGGAGFGAEGFGGAGLGASAAGFAGCPTASLPGGGAASEPPGFCSSAISIPCEDSYTYHLRGQGVKLRNRGAGRAFGPTSGDWPFDRSPMGQTLAFWRLSLGMRRRPQNRNTCTVCDPIPFVLSTEKTEPYNLYVSRLAKR